jgi:hypothetical protein
MALRPLGLLDLSIITDRLIKLIEDATNQSPLWSSLGMTQPPSIHVDGAMPEAVRKDGGCQVSVYLFHAVEDKYQKNSPVTGSRGQPIPYQPLSLNLYYLVTAFADKDYHLEQQAMSIVLRCFHENPIVREDVVIPVPPAQTVKEEFTLTMEVETSDEMARLWQAVTVPFRLSVVYKVSVVIITPPAPTVPVAPKPQRISLMVDPTLLPYAQNGQVIGTLRTVTFTPPDSTPADPKTVSFDSAPATVAPGQRFLLYGANLNGAASQQVYLLLPDGTEQEVTNWKVAEPFPQPDPLHPPQFQTESKITLDLPATVGTLPAGSPLPGVYQLRVGDATTNRSNATPFSIAARVEVTVAPPNPPILTAVAGLFTLNGVGFVAGKTEVLLDTIPLIATAGAPASGQFNVDSSGTVIAFRAPDNLRPGRYTIRVRVNHVESAPSWWINL